MSTRSIAAHLGRTPEAVRTQAHTLKLKKKQQYQGFQPGELPPRTRPIGAVRVHAHRESGPVLQVKTDSVNHWRQLSHLAWEAWHGQPLPAGHVVTMRDGNPFNFAKDNLEAITRTEVMTRNSLRNMPEDIRDAIHARATLNKVINNRIKKRKTA